MNCTYKTTIYSLDGVMKRMSNKSSPK